MTFETSKTILITIQNSLYETLGKNTVNDDGKITLNRHYEALDIAIKALEKHIPKKPLPDNKYYGNGKCPKCGAIFLTKSTHYCGNCGQALDWS